MITRRELVAAGAVAAAAAIPAGEARAQTRDQNNAISVALARYPVPLETEPAFQFKA